MNVFRTALVTGIAFTGLLSAACSNTADDGANSEGAATGGTAAAVSATCEPATLEQAEERMAPLDSAKLCADIARKASPASDAAFVKAKCLTYADRKMFNPEAGHIAALCMRDAEGGRGITAIEAKNCGGRGLRSVCRDEAANGWCATVVASIVAKTGHANDNAGGGLTQKCRWNAPGLAAAGRQSVDLCIGDSANFTSFAACIDGLGAPATR